MKKKLISLVESVLRDIHSDNTPKVRGYRPQTHQDDAYHLGVVGVFGLKFPKNSVRSVKMDVFGAF